MNVKSSSIRDLDDRENMSKSHTQHGKQRPGRDIHLSEQIRKELLREWRRTGHVDEPRDDLDLILLLTGDL